MPAETNQDPSSITKQARLQSKRVVLVTGVFDLLHQEHINFLRQAKVVGDFLIVGLETDNRVKQMKGIDRPINSQAKRIKNLNNLNIADHVFLLPQKFSRQADWENFISSLSLDIYAVSSHTKWLDNKRKIIEKFGGRLKVVHQQNPNVSTTKRINLQVKNKD